MISFEMEDLIGVLQGLTPYFIGMGIALLAAILITVLVGRQAKAKRAFIRKEAWLAALLAICVIVNLICFGPMNALISLATGSGQVTQETTDEATAVAQQIAEEGFVLDKETAPDGAFLNRNARHTAGMQSRRCWIRGSQCKTLLLRHHRQIHHLHSGRNPCPEGHHPAFA